MTSSGSPRRDRFGASASDSAKCLMLITGYQGNARLLGQVVTAAQERVLMSPSLGDFFELRWVDLGRRAKSADGIRAGVGPARHRADQEPAVRGGPQLLRRDGL